MIVKIRGEGFSFDHLRKSDEGAVTHIMYNLMLALLLEYVCHNKNTSLGDLQTGIKYISTWYSSKYKVLLNLVSISQMAPSYHIINFSNKPTFTKIGKSRSKYRSNRFLCNTVIRLQIVCNVTEPCLITYL